MAYDAAAALERIEHELIDSMMRNLRRHLKEESDMGFDWEQWQVLQLKYLEAYRKKNQKKYGPQFSNINRRIRHAIEHARVNGQKEEEVRILKTLSEHPELQKKIKPSGNADIQGGSFFKINEQKLDALIKATDSDMTRAEHAVLRRCDDQYRRIIFDAQMYANTGAGTVEKAVDMATHDFIARGIDSIVYKNGARHTISDYADMAIRTAERRAALMGAGETRKEWGLSLVIVNRRGTMTGGNFGHACPKCIPWLGKVLIDDVYSGGRPDGEHQLVSTAMQLGFLHPRCKDSFHTYYPGITSVPDPVTKKELEAGVAADRQEAQRQFAERQAEKYERLAETRLDPENRQREEARAKAWKEKSNATAPEVIGENGPIIDYADAHNFAGNDPKVSAMLRSGDALQVSEAVNIILNNRYGLTESVWEGKTQLVPDGSLGNKVLGVAHWNRKIYICESEKTNLKLHIHEQLHMRSVVKYGEEGRSLLTRFKALEEGSVELLSQAICKENHIELAGNYPEYVNPLKEIHHIICHRESEYEFARKLFDIPLEERYTYLTNMIAEYKENYPRIRESVLNRLDESLDELKEVTV